MGLRDEGMTGDDAPGRHVDERRGIACGDEDARAGRRVCYELAKLEDELAATELAAVTGVGVAPRVDGGACVGRHDVPRRRSHVRRGFCGHRSMGDMVHPPRLEASRARRIDQERSREVRPGAGRSSPTPGSPDRFWFYLKPHVLIRLNNFAGGPRKEVTRCCVWHWPSDRRQRRGRDLPTQPDGRRSKCDLHRRWLWEVRQAKTGEGRTFRDGWRFGPSAVGSGPAGDGLTARMPGRILVPGQT
jgi:hypothetical protein